jgi:prepilin signal peptidase PulO-like enzyme (type II secretory pathway)
MKINVREHGTLGVVATDMAARDVTGRGSLATLLALGIVTCAASAWWAWAGHVMTAIALMLVAPLAGRAIATDVATKRLPNPLVAATAAVGIAYAAAEAITGRPGALVGAGLGAVAAMLPMFVVHLASGGRLGFGDVKFTGALGVFAGAAHPLYALIIPLVAATIGLVGGARVRGRRRAFGPAIAAGAVASMALTPLWLRSIGGPVLWV